jgi:hypothetical protein
VNRFLAKHALLGGGILVPFHEAYGCIPEHIRTFRRPQDSLLNAGADVHAGDEHALEVAALNGHTETAKMLLEAGADPRDESSPAAAWRLAAMNGHKDTVKTLFEWTDHHPSGTENGSRARQP